MLATNPPCTPCTQLSEGGEHGEHGPDVAHMAPSADDDGTPDPPPPVTVCSHCGEPLGPQPDEIETRYSLHLDCSAAILDAIGGQLGAGVGPCSRCGAGTPRYGPGGSPLCSDCGAKS